MLATREVDSTLTDRYQTTVPEPVRRALKLGKQDKIHYAIQPDGAVLLTRATRPEPEDPALEQFLRFLSEDIARHPAQVQSIDPQLLQRIQSLVQQVQIDLDAPLSADDE